MVYKAGIPIKNGKLAITSARNAARIEYSHFNGFKLTVQSGLISIEAIAINYGP